MSRHSFLGSFSYGADRGARLFRKMESTFREMNEAQSEYRFRGNFAKMQRPKMRERRLTHWRERYSQVQLESRGHQTSTPKDGRRCTRVERGQMLGDELYEFFCRGTGLREVADERNKSRHHQGILKRETALLPTPHLAIQSRMPCVPLRDQQPSISLVWSD